MVSASIWPEELRCPKCEADAGRPFKVESRSSEEVSVTLRCSGCGHEWTLDRGTPKVVILPKLDRREEPRG